MKNANNIPEMVTVSRLSELSGFTEYSIRQLLKKNKIIHVKCGKKYLINLEKFKEFLANGENE